MKIILIVLLSLFTVGCSTYKSTEKCYKILGNELCVPETWDRLPNENALFYGQLNPDSEEAFLVYQWDTFSVGINYKQYTKLQYDKIRKDTVNELVSCSVFGFKSEGVYGYLCDFEKTSTKGDLKLKLVAFHYKEILYSFAIQYEIENESKYLDAFKRALFTFKNDGNIVIKENNEFVIEHKINLDSLE